MSDHIERLRAWRQYKDRHETDELRDALALLDDYDALAARLTEATAFGVECQRGMEEARARLAECESECEAACRGHDAAHAACVKYDVQLAECEALLRDVMQTCDCGLTEDLCSRIDAFLSREQK